MLILTRNSKDCAKVLICVEAAIATQQLYWTLWSTTSIVCLDTNDDRLTADDMLYLSIAPKILSQTDATNASLFEMPCIASHETD